MSSGRTYDNSVAYGAATVTVRRRREPRYTFSFATLCLVLLGFTAACGPKGSGKPSYEGAVSKQEACCNGLGHDSARDACLQKIVRVDDPDVQSSDENRATYACVEKHFQCDPATGTATQDSAQAQLDCITDLSQ